MGTQAGAERSHCTTLSAFVFESFHDKVAKEIYSYVYTQEK